MLTSHNKNVHNTPQSCCADQLIICAKNFYKMVLFKVCYARLAVICGLRVTGKAERPGGGGTDPGLRGRHDQFVTRIVT